MNVANLTFIKIFFSGLLVERRNSSTGTEDVSLRISLPAED